MVRQSGFTLLELLVAMTIFAIMGVMAYGGLDAIILQREAALGAMERTREVQYAIRRITTDVSQVQPRPVREELGDGFRPAVLADGRTTDLLELTRGGWPNPMGFPRSAQQRVAYELLDGILVRKQWRVLGHTSAVEAVEEELVAGIDEVEVRFLGPNREWLEEWPAPNAQDNPWQLPLAIEITLVFPDWGRISRVLEIGL
jgi:general secretion pathway protein J